MEKYKTNILISLKFYGYFIEVATHFIKEKKTYSTIYIETCKHDNDRIETFENTEIALKRFKELITDKEIKSGFFKNL